MRTLWTATGAPSAARKGAHPVAPAAAVAVVAAAVAAVGMTSGLAAPAASLSAPGARPAVVVARRCLPEILTSEHDDRAFRGILLSTGVQEIFIQGRVPVKNATNRLPTVQQEIAAMLGAE
jgi:hypothetical protein